MPERPPPRGGHDPHAGRGKQSTALSGRGWQVPQRPACSRGRGGTVGTRVSDLASCPCATWGPRGHCRGGRHTAPASVRLRASRGRMSCKGPARGHVGARGGRRQGGVGLAWGPGERAGRGAGPGGWCPDTPLTASRPSTVPRSEPYLRNRRPPAFVARFPPMWQLPFAPKSRGMMKPRSSTCRLSSSRTHPAWQTRVPAEQLALPWRPWSGLTRPHSDWCFVPWKREDGGEQGHIYGGADQRGLLRGRRLQLGRFRPQGTCDKSGDALGRGDAHHREWSSPKHPA